MRIQFERTGGFAGMKLMGIIDSEQLPATEARQFNQLVEAARLLDMPERMADAKPIMGADQFQYKLVIEAPQAQRIIYINDDLASRTMFSLLDWLTHKTRQIMLQQKTRGGSVGSTEAKDTAASQTLTEVATQTEAPNKSVTKLHPSATNKTSTKRKSNGKSKTTARKS
jgi:hypothetical protein